MYDCCSSNLRKGSLSRVPAVHNIIVREWWWFVSGLREATLLNLVFFDTVLMWLAPNMALSASLTNESRLSVWDSSLI
jgi:hypothetical protein